MSIADSANMPDVPAAVPPVQIAHHLRRFTVDQYHRMIESGILREDDRVELLNGWIVEMSPILPQHQYVVSSLCKVLFEILGDEGHISPQGPITLINSEPEPDIVVARGPAKNYRTRHPGPEDIALLVEVADTPLAEDRNVKSSLYAAAGVECYWIVNLRERCVEEHTKPKSDRRSNSYQERVVSRETDSLPLVIAGRELAHVPVSSILP